MNPAIDMKKQHFTESHTGTKDRDIIEQMEALEEIIEWLEEKDDTDIDRALQTVDVDEDEIDNWLNSPKLKKVRRWLSD